MKRILAITLIVALVAPVIARINETPTECAKRYGESITKEGGLHVFRRADLVVVVSFYKGKADRIGYFKQETDVLGINKELSDVEVQTLLNSNCADSQWVPRTAFSINGEWKTKDNKLVARYGTMDHYLMVFTQGYLDRESAAKAKKEKENLKGF